MLAKVLSCAVVGLEGVLIEVEVDVSNGGQPGVIVVGLPDAAVQESRERVRAAIRNSGGKVPFGRITVNLAPADLKKAGPTYMTFRSRSVSCWRAGNSGPRWAMP